MSKPQVLRALRGLLVAALVSGSAAGCGGFRQLVPPGGRLSTEVWGMSARLRVYTLPPAQVPPLKGVVALYVELRNSGEQSLRVSYADLWIGDKGRQLRPLPPGDLLRPASLPPRQRQLLASVAPGTLFGRGREAGTRPDTMADWNGASTLDFFSPTARTRANNLWIMRNDYDTGMQLTTAGWKFFGLPRPGSVMSLFDILASTLPDGSLLPGAAVSGFLFFPEGALPFAQKGLRWDVHEALSEEAVETLSLPLTPR